MTVIVPTFNESPNVGPLVELIEIALAGVDAEVLFVDDSTDDTPEAVARAARAARIPVRLLHRDEPVGGLSGAVVDGLVASASTWCVVMDGDLQHPPEIIPALLEAGRSSGADVAVASRYTGDGSSVGLAGVVRRLVSSVSTTLTRAMFPVRLADCTDPMTGFFAVRRDALDLDELHPRGFKVLLEILARNQLTVTEIPFVFGERHAGESKASFAQGFQFLAQLTSLRFGRMSRFAAIGVFGALVNLTLVALMTGLGAGYVAAVLVAAETTILMNFLLQERFVFRDLRHEGRSTSHRFWQSIAFNNVDTAIRLPIVVVLVATLHWAAVLATAVTLVVAFLARFAFLSRIVYRPRSRRPVAGESETETVAVERAT
ncbi:glycosyltransferase family 2 protein [Cellulomonas sp. URHD0024]|uniref:glycosyltransferase n=1 Tax=Cellulomonas sp. URHD0024 TaxID=1302620 RepID=UPI001E42281C|nr:glycosyltransferase family 2 protein [Cellulomonas sp. URHD0024]